MSLIYGYENKPQRIPVTVRYTLHYPASILNTASYPINTTSRGYRYISMNGFNASTNITLIDHVFGTNIGKNMTECTMSYGFKILLNDGSLEYHNIETINLKILKLSKAGKMYNIFPLNRKYNVSKETDMKDFSNYSVFSIYTTQSSGTLSGTHRRWI